MALINTTTTGVLGTTVFGDGTGSLTVQQNGVTQGIYGNIPAFSAYRTGSDQSVTTVTYTKVQFNSEQFDTNNNWDTTNYRFLPTVAGYYLLNASVVHNPSGATFIIRLYKNGASSTTQGLSTIVASSGTIGAGTSTGFSELVFANGTTDYFEIFGYSSAASPGFQASSYFTGHLVKAT
jgi:hypothetical protein